MKKRRNGLNPPYSLKQCLVYFSYLAYGTTYNILIIPHAPNIYEPIFYSIFNFLLISSIILHLYTSFVDPADPQLKVTKTDKSESSIIVRCSICDSSIHLFSKHCIPCNKCILKYDHHCYWVNNCIGSANYNSFFALVLVSFALACVTTASSATALVNTFIIKKKFDTDLEIAYVSFIGITGTFSFLAIWYLGYIAVFHICMISKGISTYEYLRNKKRRNLVVPRNVGDWERTDAVGPELKRIVCNN